VYCDAPAAIQLGLRLARQLLRGVIMRGHNASPSERISRGIDMKFALTNKLARDERGVSTMEYAILFVLIVVGSIAAWSTLGGTMTSKLSTGTTTLDTALEQGVNPNGTSPSIGSIGSVGSAPAGISTTGTGISSVGSAVQTGAMKGGAVASPRN
jgi:Flp pilus assembly pilin Flp